ncbi:MAG: SIMPL domain-containing protein [Thalassospira sp.]|uniref:SIMPL domain-containing protein n=1 Tax=Thalassospira sp. GB04J01 TaxID=1485225 RepID=UPI000C102858|nr:SIMPL domain-containing protein [Thalassospira sp. GB04J01]MBV16982.1 SIMPL domain-containing protein [Thalassospira sp.]|tara:strand:+ start:43802 stop:44536 length:735 start_codon:yes stop_codon:yes gene_type:complete
MVQSSGLVKVVAAVIVGVAIAGAGWFVGNGIANMRSLDRYVTVKGLAEQDVQADRAVWPITFVATDDVLQTAQAKIEADTKTLLDFLASHGISKEMTELQNLQVTDQLAQSYRSGPIESRYIVNQTIQVRTDDVKAVVAASQDIGKLLQGGIVLGGQGYNPGPSYMFTGLNDVKPEMIAAATANAREAAAQFAADSGGQLGGIRRATQGLFQILAADGAPNMNEASQINKTVRVVTTMEYLIRD